VEGVSAHRRRAVYGVLAAWLVRVWIATLRVRVHGREVLEESDAAARVLAFFHGTQLMLHGIGLQRRTCVMVSHSRDGDLQASALTTLGFEVVRGSSSRGGTRALASMVHKLRQPQTDAVFAVDGPRGPYGVVKRGVLVAAKTAGACIIPAGAAARRALVLGRAWDRFVLPWPFTRVEIVLGSPVSLGEGSGERLARAIAQCNESAAARAVA
jgi:lysophospholipid acyltransferase (LPLAT)-like uncharacterized protein